MRYDRQLLLLGTKRDSVLDLAEVQAYGRDSYGDADYVCIYGLRPAEWYAKGVRLLGRTAVGQLVVAFVAPPWGDALDAASGLDLRRTYPPIPEITEQISAHFEKNPLLFVIQVHESVNEASVDELAAGFEWSDLKIYDLLPKGSNHGILMTTKRWKPADGADTAS